MGGDGGSFASRNDIVRTKGFSHVREGKGGLGYQSNTLIYSVDRGLDVLSNRELYLTCCAITQLKLTKPVVACRMGLLYSKESLLEGLVDKTLPKSLSHIKSLKDVRDVTASFDTLSGRLLCNLTGEVISNSARVFINWDCGCIISKKALEAINGVTECPFCLKGKLENIWEIAPTGVALNEQLKKLAECEMERNECKAQKERKKTSKRKYDECRGDDNDVIEDNASSSVNKVSSSTKKTKFTET